MDPLLTIAIPTYNRTAQLETTIAVLRDIIPVDVQRQIKLRISDNNDKIELPKFDLENFNCLDVVKPQEHLLTAEENLAFLLHDISTEYVWILGDDDSPKKNGFLELWKILLNNKYDCLVFNSVTQIGSNINETPRLDLISRIHETDILDFVRIAGFWSVTAGFSTLVFRIKKFDLDFFEALHVRELFIYSHVTALIKSFHGEKFAVVREPLVNYHANPFDSDEISERNENQHWENYAKSRGRPLRDPWVYRFILQLETLAENLDIEITQFADTMEFSHTADRFFLIDAMLGMYFDQRIKYFEKEDSENFSDTEISYIKNFFYKILTRSNFSPILRCMEQIDNDLKVEELKINRKNLTHLQTQLERRRISSIKSGFAYSLPYGFIWSPFELNVDLQISGIENPRYVLHSDDFDQLRRLIKDYELNNVQSLYAPAMMDLMKLNVAGINAQVRRNHLLFSKIPKFLKKLLVKN